ncbi:thioredoxin family protein [Mycobacterium sp. MYCO198283]|uniref:thioredoxin family protein n=1 Tax=Mycobacterium sp. MYCO198283 TaxID=2883505 RepID=UPI001E4D9908|nr:thioredoxin family protein [Mycobacterium sp. MYCO198283]MCG5431283.1 thioredoxin family protein [Mycobacterium sp. MYCO198283]
MTAQWTVVVGAIAALAVAAALGVVATRRNGVLRPAAAVRAVDTGDLGLSDTGPTVVHFTAAWCGPCAGVRRVIEAVTTELGGVAHIEIDIDADPDAARRFSVLSLPTTLVFDADGRQRYRANGSLKAADLRAALAPLLA